MHPNHYCVFWRRGSVQTAYRFLQNIQILFCHTPEERMSTFSQAATASALTINSELLPAFAEGEDPWSDLWRCWCWQCLCCTHFMEKSYAPCCASSKFYSCWLDLKKREYEDWRAVQTTCVSAPGPHWKHNLGQRCSCLSLESVLLESQFSRTGCHVFFCLLLKNRWIFPNEDNFLSQIL